MFTLMNDAARLSAWEASRQQALADTTQRNTHSVKAGSAWREFYAYHAMDYGAHRVCLN